MTTRIISTAIVAWSLGMTAAVAAWADPGVSDSEIILGTTGNIVGQASTYGLGMKEGIEASLNRVNRSGGVQGRKLRVVFMEDHFDPKQALENTRKLVEQEKVFALVGGNGTQQVAAILPFIDQAGVPMLFRLSGVDSLRQPQEKNVFNIRVGYPDEAEMMVDYAVTELGVKDIGVFVQNDRFGNSGRTGVAKALGKHGLKINGDATYNLGEEDYAKQIETLKKAGCKAVYLQAMFKASQLFIKQSHAAGFSPIFLGNSLVPANAAVQALGKDATNIYLTDVLPLPSDPKYPINKEFADEMKASGFTTLDGPHLEGYLAGKLVALALDQSGKSPTRASLKAALESMTDVDVGGIKVRFNPARRQMLRNSFLLKIKDQTVTPIRALD